MSKKQGADAAQSKADEKKSASGKAAKETVRVSSGGGEGLIERATEFKEYLVLSRAELRKVSWPNWKETRATSLVVLAFVTVMAILLGLVDLLLSSVIRFILS